MLLQRSIFGFSGSGIVEAEVPEKLSTSVLGRTLSVIEFTLLVKKVLHSSPLRSKEIHGSREQ